MAERRNYLLGKGEVLTRNEKVKLGFGEGRDPYSFGEQKEYLAPLIKSVSESIDALPALACPRDEAVAVLTLHPKYLSKSAYPKELLAAAGLRAVGSKAVTLTPRKSHLVKAPVPSPSAEIFVAGTRDHFRSLATSVRRWSAASDGAEDLLKIESIRYASASERIRPTASTAKSILFEVILHAGASRKARFVLDAFREYVGKLDVDLDLESRIDASDLSFIPVRTTRRRMENLAEFTFLRVAREMSRIRDFSAATDSLSSSKSFPITLPKLGPLDPAIRVAVFDGGQPDMPQLSKWVNRIDAGNMAGPIAKGLKHGLSVSSALLFGTLKPGEEAPRPYAAIDHYRVFDTDTTADPQNALYPVLKRIEAVLKKDKYDFINFSIGPDEAIEDDDIHPWTAVIDPLLASGKALATIAVGNGGQKDATLQYNRIQPPSDCVNALSVGSSDTPEDSWKRAPYSSIGHGRCPGVMKPDGVAFGGVATRPFHVVDYSDPTKTALKEGTSFSSPAVLRAAIGVRAHLGPVLNGLALKALMIHNTHIKDHLISEVGWGQFCTDVEELITCSTGEAHVVYQGLLDPKKFLRASIPMPKTPITSMVTIKATLCIATKTDPQHPLTYTRSGLQIFFRKDRSTLPVGKSNPKATGFFKGSLGDSEDILRKDAHQWETVRHQSKRMRGADLKNPCFDIHLNPREEGHDTDGEEVPYAMIVTVSAPKVKDVFEQIFDRYRFQLEELRPQLKLPISVRR